MCDSSAIRRRSNLRRPLPRFMFAVGMLSMLACAPVFAQESADDLPTLFGQARENFQAVTDEDLSKARAELSQRAEELERYLRPGSSNGERWKKFLHWEKLEPQLAKDAQLELRGLVDVYRRLNGGQSGLERKPFRRVSDALRRVIDLASIARLPDPAKAYRDQLNQLEAEVKTYQAKPSARRALAIGQLLDSVEGLGQSPELVNAIRRAIGRPNVYVNVSSEFLTKALSKEIDDTESVYDTILGTRIRGTAKNTGSVEVKTVPADDRAILEFALKGHSRSNNVGNNGPAVIRSTGATDYSATKRVELTANEFRGLPTSVSADVDSDIHSISKRGGGIGSRMVASAGWDQARQQHSRADAIASDHAEDRIRSQFDQEVRDALRDLWKRYAEGYRNPLLGRGQWPEDIRLRSTEDALALEARQASRGQIAAAGEPPTVDSTHVMDARVHESAVNNLGTAILGGATMSESADDKEPKIDTPVPKWFRELWEEKRLDKKPADFTPWSLSLRRIRPLTVEFADNGVIVTLHIARLESGSDDFRSWDATAKYDLTIEDGVLKATRPNDVEFFPTEFDPAGNRRLSPAQVAIRSNLNKIFNERQDAARTFPRTFDLKPIKFSGDFSHVAPLRLEKFSSGDGWMNLAWEQADDESEAGGKVARD